MKIRSVKAIPVKLPLPHVMEWATGRMTAQSHVLVRIMTDEGIEGIAHARFEFAIVHERASVSVFLPRAIQE